MRTDGQTDRHDEANSRFSKFCKRAYKLEPPTARHISNNITILDAFSKLRQATISFIMPVRSSVRMKQYGSH